MMVPIIDNEPGWVGAFTRDQADGAIPNGKAVVKTRSEEGDGHPDGTPGVILGSLSVGVPNHKGELVRFGYFVAWAPRPRCATFTADFKLRESNE